MSITAAAAGRGARSRSSRRLAGHALGGGVDQQGGALQGLGAAPPRDAGDGAPDVAGHGLGPGPGPVNQAQLPDPGAKEGGANGPRRPAGADHHDRSQPRVPIRESGPQAGEETEGIRVHTPQPAVGFDDHGVDGTDGERLGIGFVDQGQGCLLVGNRDVEADEANARQKARRLAQVLGTHRQGHVGAVDDMVAQPIVDAGKARSNGGPASR